MAVKILTGDCRDVLRTLPDESVHCCVTSPPYWGLRDYGTAQWEGGDPGCKHDVSKITSRERVQHETWAPPSGWTNRDATPNAGNCKCGARRIDSQLGLELFFQDYIETMVQVFREVRRVLRKDGTCWVNMGDSYAGAGIVGDPRPGCGRADGIVDERAQRNRNGIGAVVGLKAKDLCGIPWRLAFALQADGWWLRSDIIWSKPNPMPESVTDRPTKAHEYLFLLSKAEWYYYDAEAIKEAAAPSSIERINQPTFATQTGGPKDYGNGVNPNRSARKALENFADNGGMRNRRTVWRAAPDVWEIATAPFSEAHFATFPPALVEPCIKAGTSEKGCCAKCGAPWVRETDTPDWYKKLDGHKMPSGTLQSGVNAGFGAKKDSVSKPSFTVGWSRSCSCVFPLPVMKMAVPCTVLDPFGGAGTTGLVADRLGRNAILIELNPQYAEMARKRIENDAGLFYNADKDFGGSIDECYKAIRERKANGGPGWSDEKQQELL